MIATQLLVVPRSMPMILPMMVPFGSLNVWLSAKWRSGCFASSAGGVGGTGFRVVARLGDGDERRAQHTVVEQVPLLENLDDGARRLIGLEHGHRLMPMRVVAGIERIDFGDVHLGERGLEVLERQLDAILERLDGRCRG